MIHFDATNLPRTIPVFPLPNVFLLPRARLPLNIFEPRYLAMLEDTLKTDHRLIGLVQPRPAPPGTGDPQLHQIGCAGRVTSFTETADGRYQITLSGICRFRINTLNTESAPYIRANVDWDSFHRDLGTVETDAGFDRSGFLQLLDRFFQKSELATDWENLKATDEELLINSLAMMCPFKPEEKQALLEAPTLHSRRETLVTLMEFALRLGDEKDQLQ